MKVTFFACALVTANMLATLASAQQGCASQLSPSSSVNSLISCMQELEQRISQTLPQGTVAAFDIPGGCPSGWREFQEGAGRVIVGAGRGNSDEKGAFLEVRQLSETGGFEAVELRPQEVPSEVTRMDGVSVSGDGFLRLLKEETLRSTSISQWALRVPTGEKGPAGEIEVEPHKNMPPFIVLHFCKKQ